MTKRYLKTPEEVIQALKEGKIVETENNEYKLIDGMICGFQKQKGQWMLGHSIFESEEAYIEEPKPLKLEVGKFYKTRDGHKVFVAYIDRDCLDKYPPVCVVIIGTKNRYWVRIDGLRYTDRSAADIVAPWEEH